MLKIGITGLPNVGKSTLFNAVTKQKAAAENYPFTTINPNIGIVEVSDERLTKLAEFLKSPKVVPTTIEFVDIAGLIGGASCGEGLGNKFLAHIKETNALMEVVRVFPNEKIIHIYNKTDPGRDIIILETELILHDLETIRKRIGKSEKGRYNGNKESAREIEILKEIKTCLEKGVPARESRISEKEYGFLMELQLLTFKPVIYVFNGAEEEVPQKLKAKSHITLDLKLEAEMTELSNKELKELGLVSNIGKLISEAYKLLGLITFYTHNENEARAWSLPEGTTIIEAAGKIHSDLANGFIKAEVVNIEQLLGAGSHAAREKASIKIEGKDYIVKEGDVIMIKFKA